MCMSRSTITKIISLEDVSYKRSSTYVNAVVSQSHNTIETMHCTNKYCKMAITHIHYHTLNQVCKEMAKTRLHFKCMILEILNPQKLLKKH